MKVKVITYQIWQKLNLDKKDVIITVSRSKNWSRGLSPFVLGPCELYDGYVSKNMEGAWQFSKVYKKFIKDGDITEEYFKWAKEGWDDTYAHRYPMGKNAIPEFSYWDGKRLGYIEARKRIYIPLYYDSVKNTDAFRKLRAKYEIHKREGRDLYLIDFDAYDHRELGMSYTDVINCEERKMGHGFVLAMMLELPEKLSRAVSRVRG